MMIGRPSGDRAIGVVMNDVLLEHLRRWVGGSTSDLSAGGLHLSFTRGPVARDEQGAWVDIESSTRTVRLIVWESGEANLAVADLVAGGIIVEEHLEITSRFGLEQALGSAVAWADPGSSTYPGGAA